MRIFKHKYIKVLRFSDDKSLTVSYIKRDQFNKDQTLLVNPDHIFNHNGYQTIVTSVKSAETIDPLDFQSRYPVALFKTAISSKLISDTFATLKKPKIDMLMISMMLNGLTFLAIMYLFLQARGVL